MNFPFKFVITPDMKPDELLVVSGESAVKVINIGIQREEPMPEHTHTSAKSSSTNTTNTKER